MSGSRLVNRNFIAARGRTSAIRVFIVEYFYKGVSIPADIPSADHAPLDAAAMSFVA